jgi:hypothetical protein
VIGFAFMRVKLRCAHHLRPPLGLAGCPVPDPGSDFSPLDDGLTDIQHNHAANVA